MGSAFSSEETGDATHTVQGKRKRDDDGNNTAATASADERRPTKRPRRSRFSVADTWISFREGMTYFFAKCFLLSVEMVIRGNPSGKLAEEEEVISALMQMLDYFQSTDLEILKRGWQAMYACGAKPYDEECDSDVSTVVAVMRRHSNSIRLQLLGCRALRTLMNRDDDWHALLKAGAIEVLLKSVSNFPDDIVMQGLAITFVAMLVREEGETPRRQVLESDGIELILRAMQRFEHDPRLQHTGCYALHQMGFGVQTRSQILLHGGIHTLIRIVERHTHDECLVDLCLSTLSKLSDENSLQGHEVIPLVLRSMERYPKEQAIQGHCLVLLYRATARETTSRYVQDSIRLVLAAMRNFQESSSLQFFACAALREILLQSPINRQALEVVMESGGVECVLQAVENHRDIFGLQPMALLFLMRVWEQRPPQQEAAASAFGGGDHVILLVAGQRMAMDIDDID